MTKVTAIIPAAGIGSRMQSALPKQYLKIVNKTVIEHTMDALIKHPKIDRIIVALNPLDVHFKKLSIANKPWLSTVVGGSTRAESVISALHACEIHDWALVHDAARPCVNQKDLDSILQLQENGSDGGILATPVRDTMKRTLVTGQIDHTVERENLWHALTPQFFPSSVLLKALLASTEQGADITDEASAMEWADHHVNVVKGCASNIKITQPEDLALAEFYLTQRAQA